MSIEELYQWAKESGVEKLPLCWAINEMDGQGPVFYQIQSPCLRAWGPPLPDGRLTSRVVSNNAEFVGVV